MGVVLAGGLSSRMQSDKTQFIWRGKTLIEYTSELLAEAGCSEVLVSSNTNPEYINDRYPGSGPLAGIDACLNQIQSKFSNIKAMLIMPVDMPLMRIDLLAQLREQAERGNAVYYNLGRFPLILPVNKDLASNLTYRLENHQSGRSVSIRQLLSELNCQVLDLDKGQQKAFYNCNTPQQWQNLQLNANDTNL